MSKNNKYFQVYEYSPGGVKTPLVETVDPSIARWRELADQLESLGGTVYFAPPPDAEFRMRQIQAFEQMIAAKQTPPPANKPPITNEQVSQAEFVREMKSGLSPTALARVNAAEKAGKLVWAKPQPTRTAAQKIRIYEQLALEQDLAEGLAEQAKFNKFFSVPSGPLPHISLNIPPHKPNTTRRTVKNVGESSRKPVSKITSDVFDVSRQEVKK